MLNTFPLCLLAIYTYIIFGEMSVQILFSSFTIQCFFVVVLFFYWVLEALSMFWILILYQKCIFKYDFQITIQWWFFLLLWPLMYKSFKFWHNPIYLFFCCLRFWCHIKEIIAKSKVIKFSPMFSSKHFIVLPPPFISLIHFKVLLVYAVLG